VVSVASQAFCHCCKNWAKVGIKSKSKVSNV
jgi:hypothetical protein